MLSLPVRFQRLKPIARGNAKIAEDPGLIQKTKLSERDILNIGRQFPAALAGPDQFRFRIGEALDHERL